MDYDKTIKELCGQDGVSGFEQQIGAFFFSLIEPFCDRVETDRLGNVSGHLSCGRKDVLTVMLDAHIDQIGFLVSDILDGGFLSFVPMGGVDRRMLPGAEVRLFSGNGYKGIVSCLPPHILSKEERNKPFEADMLVVDTGFSKEEAKERFPIGTPVAFQSGITHLADDFVSGASLDNRAGMLALASAAERLSKEKRNVNIVVQGSVMEEKNANGARAGTYKNRPDFALVVDVTHAKTPDAPFGQTFPAGSGAMIGAGPNLNRNLMKMMRNVAEEKKIPFGLEVMEGATGTNAWAMQIVASGIPCSLLSIPLKYMHTPIETVKLSDIRAVSDLIYEFILSLDGGAICWNS